MIDQATLKQIVHYNPETGAFTWIKDGHRRKGCTITSRNAFGYIQVWIAPKNYSGHRLAWLYVHGELPQGHIDHANGDPADNRIINLRLCDDALNHGNMKVKRKGLKGAWFNKSRGTWHAIAQCRGEKHYLGTFPSEEAAHEFYMAKAKELFGEFARAS